jgi:hypothetical protein
LCALLFPSSSISFKAVSSDISGGWAMEYRAFRIYARRFIFGISEFWNTFTDGEIGGGLIW